MTTNERAKNSNPAAIIARVERYADDEASYRLNVDRELATAREWCEVVGKMNGDKNLLRRAKRLARARARFLGYYKHRDEAQARRDRKEWKRYQYRATLPNYGLMPPL